MGVEAHGPANTTSATVGYLERAHHPVRVSHLARCRRRTLTHSDRQPFESARFRDAFGSGIAHSSGMAMSIEPEAIAQGRGKI